MRFMKNNCWFKDLESVEEPSAFQRFTNAHFSPTVRKVLDKTVWLMSTARNAVIVVICVGIAMAVMEDATVPRDDSIFILTGDIDSDGVPAFEPPPFDTTNNSTGTAVEVGFVDMLKELGTGLFIIPLISVLENVAIAKSFCK